MPNQESPLPKLDSLVIAIRSALQGKLDSKVGTAVYEQHTQDNVSHVTAEERDAWNNKADSSHTHTVADISDLSNLYNITEMSDTDVDNAMSVLLESEGSATLMTYEEIGNPQTVETNNTINVNEVIEEDPDDGTDIDNVTTAETANTYDNV